VVAIVDRALWAENRGVRPRAGGIELCARSCQDHGGSGGLAVLGGVDPRTAQGVGSRNGLG
jgi:hypothetical protein